MLGLLNQQVHLQKQLPLSQKSPKVRLSHLPQYPKLPMMLPTRKQPPQRAQTRKRQTPQYQKNNLHRKPPLLQQKHHQNLNRVLQRPSLNPPRAPQLLNPLPPAPLLLQPPRYHLSANRPVASQILKTATNTTSACGFLSVSTSWNKTAFSAWLTTQLYNGAPLIRALASQVSSPVRHPDASPMLRITPSTSGACGTYSVVTSNTTRTAPLDKCSMPTADDASHLHDPSWYRTKKMIPALIRTPTPARILAL